MKVTGFTFIKNALIYDFPIIESIQSILAICDEIVVAVGKSEDKTLELIQSIQSDKIRIIESVWDENLREGGRVLALETDKALAAIAQDTDWAFYIQGDEVVHEKYHHVITENMHKYKDDKRVDGLLFKYLHFYGSYDYAGNSSDWYGHEIRVIRNNKTIYSYKDAQGFRKGNNKKLSVKPIDAYIYHYGWVKNPAVMNKKHLNFNKYWHDDAWIEKESAHLLDYTKSNRVSLKLFDETHPEVMLERIKAKNWDFKYEESSKKFSAKDRIKHFLKRLFGINLNYANYKKI